MAFLFFTQENKAKVLQQVTQQICLGSQTRLKNSAGSQSDCIIAKAKLLIGILLRIENGDGQMQVNLVISAICRLP